MAPKLKQMSAPAILALSMGCAIVGTAFYLYVLALTERMDMVHLEPPSGPPAHSFVR